MIAIPDNEVDPLLQDQDELRRRRQALGSLIAAGKADEAGWNPKATAKRRAKNRVAATSRRKNRRR
jgi:hypothetical protein